MHNRCNLLVILTVFYSITQHACGVMTETDRHHGGNTNLEDEEVANQIQKLKKKLLDGMGLDSIPKDVIPIGDIPEPLLRGMVLTEKDELEADDSEITEKFQKKKIMVFGKINSLSECDNGKQCLKASFKRRISHSELDIVSARLWVFRRKKDMRLPSTLTITTRQRRYGGNHFVHRSHTAGGEKVDGWFVTQLKISDIVQNSSDEQIPSFSKQTDNSKFVVKFNALLKCDNCEFIDKKSYRPFIGLNTVTRIRKIRRRSVDQDKCSGGCCRKSLKISFKDLGWDFVYHPREYNAYYCQGSCSNKTQVNQAKHTLFTAVGIKIKYCCSPKSFIPLKILYVHEGSLIRRLLPDMVVKDCWCV